MTRKAIPGCERELEALDKFVLDEDGCSLVALICILLVNCGVMLRRIVAALQDGGH